MAEAVSQSVGAFLAVWKKKVVSFMEASRDGPVNPRSSHAGKGMTSGKGGRGRSRGGKPKLPRAWRAVFFGQRFWTRGAFAAIGCGTTPVSRAARYCKPLTNDHS